MASKKKSASGKSRSEARETEPLPGADLGQFMLDAVTNWTRSALDLAARSTAVPGKLAGAILLDPGKRDELQPEVLQLMADAGSAVHDARKLAGLTVEEVTDALRLKDGKLLSAVESGTATLSFDLILRLASLVARHDPLPFVLKLARAYNPQAWQALEGWGVGRLQVQFAREREFINILRSHDEVRDLDDEQFDQVLKFTDRAFAMALAFRRGELDDPVDDEE